MNEIYEPEVLSTDDVIGIALGVEVKPADEPLVDENKMLQLALATDIAF